MINYQMIPKLLFGRNDIYWNIKKYEGSIQKVELDKEICYDLFNEISLYQNKVLWKLMESNNYKKLIIITIKESKNKIL